MKKNFTPFVLLLSALFFAAGCADDNSDDGVVLLKLAPYEVTVTPQANSSASVTILTQSGFTVEVALSDRKWLAASVSGNTLTVTALLENEGVKRMGVVYVTAGTGENALKRGLKVYQDEPEKLPEPLPAESYKWSNHPEKQYYPFMTEYTGSLTPSTATFQKGKTRIVPYLIGYTADSSIVRYRSVTNKYGSRTDKAVQTATGHFYTKKIGDRWFFVDPLGYLHHHHGVTSVRHGSSSRNAAAWSAKYGTDARWIASIRDEMADIGIHASGSFCNENYSVIQQHNAANPEKPLILCPSFGFLTAFRREVGASPGGVTANNPGLVFYDGWKDFCKRYVQEVLAPYKNDPNTIGFFSDNEIGFTDNGDDVYLAKRFLDIPDPNNPARKAVEKWMQDNNISGPDKIYFATNGQFAGIMAEKYYEGVRAALDELGIKTLYFGSRLHGNPKGIESIIKAAGRYCDVISINLYGYWDITNKQISGENSRVYDWHQWTDTPFFISEFYTRAVESDLPNTSGGGYLVKTQKDRAYVYQHVALGLIESPHCVGWTWFKYQDDDGTDNDNRPANKGLYDNYYNMYPWLARYMKGVNVNAFELIEYFDGQTY